MGIEGGPEKPKHPMLKTPLATCIERFISGEFGKSVRLDVAGVKDGHETVFEFQAVGSTEDPADMTKLDKMILTLNQIRLFLDDGDFDKARKLAESNTKFQSDSEKDLQDDLLAVIDRVRPSH